MFIETGNFSMFKLKKKFLLILIFFLIVFSCYTKAQYKELLDAYNVFAKYYNSGDFINAEKCLSELLASEIKISEENQSKIYNNLGATYTKLGNSLKALEYYKKAETTIVSSDQDIISLAPVFINIGFAYYELKSYSLSREYYEKGIRIYLSVKNPGKEQLDHLSTAYLNAGIVYYEYEDYQTALRYLRKSAVLKKDNMLSESALVFLNIAKTLSKLKNYYEADKFFNQSVESSNKEFGENYYRLSEIYFGYGQFLQAIGKADEALEIHRKALSINLKNYNEKHPYVALSYSYIGEDHFQLNNVDSALFYYQKSLIANSRNFSSPDIFLNPSIDSTLFDIRLLHVLKRKSQAFELFALKQTDQETKLKTLNSGVGTIELALQLIDRIRNKYMSEDSRIYLAENEKETYLFATHLAYSLYSATYDKTVGYKIYDIARKAKAAILRNEITENEVFYSAGIPDSLRDIQNKLNGNIIAYNNLILEETRKTNPDSNKISLWKDAVFDMNREKERVTANIEKVFPQYRDLLRKTDPVPLELIRKKLDKDETIVDYLLSNQYSGGKRKLYIFLISRKEINFRELWLDSLFVRNAEIIRKTADPSMATGSQSEDFINYTGALNYMYLNLVKPVEELLKGKRIIIIPDEEVEWLPFDAFLKDLPSPDQTGYEGLHYLVNDYTFSWGYSSSLIFGKNRHIGGAKVFAFSPGYRNKTVSGNELSSLQGADDEIGSIFKWFSGNTFSGENATKANFISALQDRAIFHLAMHSMSDTLNSKYSYLMFDDHNNSTEESKLYNSEISLTRIKSPMVVLSACNSGTGTLYSGEGLMSMARGFTLAGASSVIKTSWEINDEASEAIMTRFYFHLSKGKEKNEAMRFAKLEYLESSPPSFTNPYYWAAYEVLGDNEPVARKSISTVIILSLIVILATTLSAIYFKRRRIFSDRSR